MGLIRLNLEGRDSEILRTLGRLRYMTTREIASAFFTTDDLARRRLRKLSGWDLIRSHDKGVAKSMRYQAWRLTTRGIDQVSKLFPGELFPDGMGERIADTRLFNTEHREAISRAYLGFLLGAEPRCDNKNGSVSAYFARIRSRANQIDWQADGDVTLRVSTLAGEKQVVPDATITARQRNVRLFLEMDRSSRALTRIGHAMERYKRFLFDAYAKTFPDGKSPVVLFVAPSQARRDGIARFAERILTPAKWVALVETDAGPWLSHTLLGEKSGAEVAPLSPVAPSVAPNALDAIGREVYTWFRGYQKQLLAEGRDLPGDGQAVLRKLYAELRTEGRHEG